MPTNTRGRNRRESHIAYSVNSRHRPLLDRMYTFFHSYSLAKSPHHLSHLLLLLLVLHELPVVKKSVWHVAAAMLGRFGGDARDESGLLGAGGIHRRSSRLLWAACSPVGTTEHGSQNAHSQLRVKLVGRPRVARRIGCMNERNGWRLVAQRWCRFGYQPL